ncbi:MAG: SIMPL domain-containing protein [Candidatus Pacebacteria bacterium]|nr:SIMPL domain-containing protein [Candidatus Paceibacterota bacterium]
MNTSHHFNFTSEELNSFLKIVGAAAIGVLTLFLVVKTMNEIKTYSTIGDDASFSVQNVISVTGKSDMDVTPDITTFEWSIEADGKTSEESQSKSATINNKAIAFVKEKGIKEADIKTTGLNTYPKYETSYKNCISPMSNKTTVSGMTVASPTIMPPCNTESVISGYTTSQSVRVKVRDINKNQKIVGELVAGLATVGVRVSTPVNTIDDMDAYKRVVRDEAILKARQEAEVLAKSLGVKLVRITSFNENGGGYYPYAMDAMSSRSSMMEKAAVTPDLPTGTNKVSSEVNITYQIK